MSRVPQLRSLNPMPMGIGFVIAVVIALFLSFNLHQLPFAGGTVYTAAFSEAAGLHKGDKVTVAGVEVGEVTDVLLDGARVLVKFRITDDHLRLGSQTSASIQIFTLLGNKYVALEPKGSGRWPAERVLPLERTQAPYDVVPAFQDLSDTVERIDTRQLAQAFDTMAATFRDTPPELKSMLSGLSRLAQTVAARDEQLSQLLRHSSSLTGVLADRREEFAKILGDGSDLLRMVRERREVISQLLDNTAALSTELTGLVGDNQAQIQPMLDHLRSVVGILDSNQKELDETIRRLYVFVRGEVDATGAGPWFDGTAMNALNPIDIGDAPPLVSNRPPRTFGELLRIPGTVAR